MTKVLNINKKIATVFAVILTAASLAGCQSDIEPAPDITSGIEDGTKSDISQANEISIGEVTDSGEEVFIPKLLMETDKPFVLAEENYIIEKQDIDLSKLSEYGRAEYAHDGKFYYSSDASFEYSDSEAKIYAYDLKSGELTTFYSEAPEGEGCLIDLDIRLIDEDYLYFYREAILKPTENQSFQLLGRDLYKVNLRDNTAEKIFSYTDEEVMPSGSSVASAGDILFIPAIHEAINDYRFMIFQYDMNTGEISLFRDSAQRPILYNNGILYYHDGGYYYHGEASDINGQGVFYEGDELIFYPDIENSLENLTSNIELDALIYTCVDDDEDYIIAGSSFGFFDKNFNKKLIAHTEKNTWMIGIDGISKTGLVAIDAPKPMIYDTNEECFAVISIDDYQYYRSFVTDDCVCFLGYDATDDKYTSAALYTVKRR